MKSKLIAGWICAIFLASPGVPASLAGESGTAACIQFSPEPEMNGWVDTGGYSLSTGEHLMQSAAYFVAHIEQPDGGVHPAFGGKARGVFIFKTMGGHLVLRMMDIPAGKTQ